MPVHHLIFEGAELTGKSWIISQIYNFLEQKYNQTGNILDGCHWFNCDVGIYGTNHGKPINESYLKICEELKNSNIILEKFHISDVVYNKLFRGENIAYGKLEEKLSDLNFKIILITFPKDIKILEKRIKDRLNLYPHYARILKDPSWYLKQQEQYLEEIKKTKLPHLIVETQKLPDDSLVKKILSWI